MLFLGFLLTIVLIFGALYTIFYYMWQDKFGPTQTIWFLHKYNFNVRTRLNNWRDKLQYIDNTKINSRLISFLQSHPKYDMPSILNNTEICFVTKLSKSSATNCGYEVHIEKNWAEFKRKYVIAIDINKVFRERISSVHLANMLIDAIKFIYITNKYRDSVPYNRTKEWEEDK